MKNGVRLNFRRERKNKKTICHDAKNVQGKICSCTQVNNDNIKYAFFPRFTRE